MALDVKSLLPLGIVAAAAYYVLGRRGDAAPALEGSAGAGPGTVSYGAGGGVPGSPAQASYPTEGSRFASAGEVAQGAAGPGGQIPAGQPGSTLFGPPTFSTWFTQQPGFTMPAGEPGSILSGPPAPAVIQAKQYQSWQDVARTAGLTPAQGRQAVNALGETGGGPYTAYALAQQLGVPARAPPPPSGGSRAQGSTGQPKTPPAQGPMGPPTFQTFAAANPQGPPAPAVIAPKRR